MHLGAIPNSKIPKKESKLNQNWKRGSASKRVNWSADQHMASANWHKVKAQPRNLLIKIKLIFFKFLGITPHSNSYLI